MWHVSNLNKNQASYTYLYFYTTIILDTKPENSSFQIREQLDVYGDLELKLSSVGQHVDKLCFGDYNARTGIKLDYLESEDNTDIPVPLDIYETDINFFSFKQ